MKSRRYGASGSHVVGDLFTFTLFGLFVILSLLIVVIGVENYRGVVDSSESAGSLRTSIGYVAGKVRSNAAIDGLRLEERDGAELLILTEVYEGTTYETIIYHRDGRLCESYINAEYMEEFQIGDGSPLVDIAAFDFTLDGGLLELTATTAGGQRQTLHLATPAGLEEGER